MIFHVLVINTMLSSVLGIFGSSVFCNFLSNLI